MLGFVQTCRGRIQSGDLIALLSHKNCISTFTLAQREQLASSWKYFCLRFQEIIRQLAIIVFCLIKTLIPECSWIVMTQDRKSTRLNSSHVAISYAVFCLK